MPNKSAARIEAERLAVEFPDTPTRTLATKLSKSHKTTVESARSLLRVARGNMGKRDRKKATAPRPNQSAGWKPEMPPSLAEKWDPFDLGNGIRVAVLSDLHVPYHSMVAVKAAVDYCMKKKPSTVVLNGDVADFYSISRHQKDPSKRDLEQEITAVREMLAWIRYQFGKKCRIVYKIGNHEDRWAHYLWNCAPEISHSPRMDVKEWLDAEKYGIEMVGEQRPIMVGKLPVFHGHELGKGISSPVNAARGAFMRTLSTLLVGHSHRSSHHTEPNVWGTQTSCWSTGCLADLRPAYAVINKWQHGAAFVEVENTGEYRVENFRIGPNGEIW